MLMTYLQKIAVCLVFVVGAMAYTWPAADAIWEQRTDVFMSDGTDPTGTSLLYETLHKTLIDNPKLFFYGAIPSTHFDAPEGALLWFCGIEKVAALILPAFVPYEQMCVSVGLLMMIFSGLAFYAFGRSMGWNKGLSLALGIAWAFSPYTRARAQVHPSLIAIYCFPLSLLALRWLQKSQNKMGVLKTAFLFFLASLVPHYFLIYLAFFSPLFLLFYFSRTEIRQTWKKSLMLLVVAAAPTVLFLAFSMLKPAPADFIARVKSVYPTTGESQTWPHPFLSIFMATPQDYFTGDVAIGEARDFNPARESLNLSFRQNLKAGNFHEHAQGIRWTVWVFFLCGIVYLLKSHKNKIWTNEDKFLVITFLIFAIFTFLSSLKPDWGVIWGPSAWIHYLVPQIRTPNRTAILAHLSILVCLGVMANKWFSTRKSSTSAWIFCFLILIDFLPFQNPMPMAQILPSRKVQIEKKSGPCGIGYHFPHTSGNFDMLIYYSLMQSLRGTDCSILNPYAPNQRDARMAQLFSYQNPVAMNKVVNNDDGLKSQLVQFANCNHLDWLVFDHRVPTIFMTSVCDKWGGDFISPDFCRSKSPADMNIPLGLPDQCLQNL